MSDEQYLRAWAEQADETAFRTLVGRYAGFIYGAALRRVGDAGLAEEITQDVFARLSQNAARLVGHPAISGWLHRAAMLLALDRLRRRSRAERRIAQLSQMTTPTAADPLAEALPHLDEALDQLASRDREVLVLHFFDRLTFPEIATRLGGTADAARMRNNRALSALSATLRKKGVTLSVTALSTGLGGTFAQAAPATLAIIPAALGAGKVSALSVIIHALETMKLAKAAALTALALVLATPLIFQQQQIAAAEARIAVLEKNRDTQQDFSKDGKLADPTVRASDFARSIDIKQLAVDAVSNTGIGNYRIRRSVARLDANNLAGLIETVLHGSLMRVHRAELLNVLLSELRQRDHRLHLECTMKVASAILPYGPTGVRCGTLKYHIYPDAFRSYRAWVATNPDDALRWAANHREEWREFCAGEDSWKNNIDALSIAGLVVSDPSKAFAMLDEMPLQECVAALESADHSWNRQQSLSLAKWASGLADADKRRHIVRKAVALVPVSFSESKSDERIAAWTGALGTLALNDSDIAWIAPRVLLDSFRSFQADTKAAPVTAVEWVRTNVAVSHRSYATGVLGRWFRPKQALAFLEQRLDAGDGDDLIAGYVESDDVHWRRYSLPKAEGRHSEIAFKLAAQTKDPRKRTEWVLRSWNVIHRESATTAREVLEHVDLTAEDRAALESRLSTIPNEK
jgi:RNA polymerase sigma-70 factor, ECF subfamily